MPYTVYFLLRENLYSMLRHRVYFFVGYTISFLIRHAVLCSIMFDACLQCTFFMRDRIFVFGAAYIVLFVRHSVKF